MKNFLFLISVLLVSVSFGQTAEEYSHQGVAKFKLQDYTGAIADFNKAIELDPDPADGAVYLIRGFAKFSLQDYKGAIADYTKAIAISPANANGFKIIVPISGSNHP